jgi:hypothetical protein
VNLRKDYFGKNGGKVAKIWLSHLVDNLKPTHLPHKIWGRKKKKKNPPFWNGFCPFVNLKKKPLIPKVAKN